MPADHLFTSRSCVLTCLFNILYLPWHITYLYDVTRANFTSRGESPECIVKLTNMQWIVWKSLLGLKFWHTDARLSSSTCEDESYLSIKNDFVWARTGGSVFRPVLTGSAASNAPTEFTWKNLKMISRTGSFAFLQPEQSSSVTQITRMNVGKLHFCR